MNLLNPNLNWMRLAAVIAAINLSAGANAEAEATHGVMAAEVDANSAIIWSRTDREAVMHVRLRPGHGNRIRSVKVKAEDDFTGQIELRGLRPNTHYEYEVWFSEANKGRDRGNGGIGRSAEHGSFMTAPKKSQRSGVKIAWSGDFAGQNVCRDATEGFPIFQAIDREDADFFIGLGDMIYADNTCGEVGLYGNPQVPGDFIQSADLTNFWAHWRYGRADDGFQALLASTPYFGIWDDHEVVNDFGPLADTRSAPPYVPGEPLLPIGLKAFLDYTPMTTRSRTPKRLYRNVRWGRHAELFFLDNRQYRDANLAADAEDQQKTMLGREQLTWLNEKIKASNATWKIIVSSVPISIPTGFPQDLGRDGWANFDPNMDPIVDGTIPQSDTGFEQELIDILRTLQETHSKAVFITTDVHFAEVFSYTPFASDPSFVVHEVVIGPGNAGLFPNRDFDTTLGTSSLFFFGPNSAGDVTTWVEAKKWFNYGVIEIDQRGALSAKVKDTVGETQFELNLMP